MANFRGTPNNTEVYICYDCDLLRDKTDNAVDKTKPIFNSLNTTHIVQPDLSELNRQKSASFYPIFIVLGCIVVLGVLWNILVCYIYRCRARRATSNFFVIFFAIFDIVGCLVGIPLVVSSLALPYTYTVTPLCKIMGFVETLIVCGQCLTFICVAYDCYRKLCRPAEDFNLKKARLLCFVSLLLAVLLSIPALIVYDTRMTTTSYPGVLGETCSVDMKKPQWLRIMFYVCVLGSFTVSLSVMTTLYCLIWVNWYRQRQAEERGEKPSPAKREFPKKHRFVREDTSSSSVVNYTEEICRLHSQGNLSQSSTYRSDPARAPLKSSSTGIVKTNSLQASSAPPSVANIVQLHVKNTRQASIFMVISTVFAVFMIPYVVVMILCASTTVFEQFSSITTEIVVNLCLRSYLCNYLVKPVVYMIRNMKFRKEVKHLFSKVLGLCARPDSGSEQNSARQQHRSFKMGAPRSTSRQPIYRPPRSSN